MFLPIISPHSFISNVTAERANEVSPDSWNTKNTVPFYQQWSQVQKTVTTEIFHEYWLSCDLSEKKYQESKRADPRKHQEYCHDCLGLFSFARIVFPLWLFFSPNDCIQIKGYLSTLPSQALISPLIEIPDVYTEEYQTELINYNTVRTVPEWLKVLWTDDFLVRTNKQSSTDNIKAVLSIKRFGNNMHSFLL